ncbi:hypothetical protein NHJ13051_003139 [Beauveria bassiana]
MKAVFAFTLTAGLPVALASAILGPRIIGPDEPTDRFKFVVSIQNSTKAHYCGGILLDSTTVLTANHCIFTFTDAGFVVAGKTDLEATGGVTVKISTLQRHLHKAYSKEDVETNNKMGDIAIIKLATPIEKSDDIDYAPLPESDAVLDGSEELVGVGCGGPLIDSKTGTVVGIVSATYSSLAGRDCTDATIFTRVGSYLDFINENLGQRGFTDGDNQSIKDEVKRAILLGACHRKHDQSYGACLIESLHSNRDPSLPEEEEWAECRPFKDLKDACVPCAEKATADSTVETVIQCSEAMKKGD